MTTRRAEENGNPLAVTLRRIIGMRTWDVAAEAVAEWYVPDCIRGGFVSANSAEMTSGNASQRTGNRLYNDICWHGQNMVYDAREQDWRVGAGNGNIFELGVVVSMPDLAYLKADIDKNNGLAEALMEQDVYPRDAMRIGDLVQELEAALDSNDKNDPLVPDYVQFDASGTQFKRQTLNGKNFPPPALEPGTIYKVNCNGNQQISLPTNVPIGDIVLVTDCRISASNLLDVSNVMIVSTAVGNGQDPTDLHAISLASKATIGSDGFSNSSTGDGAVQIYALATVHLAAKFNVSGLRAVVGGDFEMTAGGDVIGIAAQAMGRISATSGGDFGLCHDGPDLPGPFAKHSRLVF